MSQMSSQSRLVFTPAFLMLAILFVFIVASLLQLTPPPVLPADAPAGDFSAERAYMHMHAMDVGPHWTGSEGNMQVRDYIAEQLRGMGLEVEIQTVQSFFEFPAARKGLDGDSHSADRRDWARHCASYSQTHTSNGDRMKNYARSAVSWFLMNRNQSGFQVLKKRQLSRRHGARFCEIWAFDVE